MKRILNAVLMVVVLAGIAGAMDINGDIGAYLASADRIKADIPKVEAQAAAVKLPPLDRNTASGKYVLSPEYKYRTPEKAAELAAAWKARLEASGLGVTDLKVVKDAVGYGFELAVSGGEVALFRYDTGYQLKPAERGAIYKAMLDGMRAGGVKLIASGIQAGNTQYSDDTLWFNYLRQESRPAVQRYRFIHRDISGLIRDEDKTRVVSMMKSAGLAVIAEGNDGVAYVDSREKTGELNGSTLTDVAARIALAKNAAILKLKGAVIMETSVFQVASSHEYHIGYILK